MPKILQFLCDQHFQLLQFLHIGNDWNWIVPRKESVPILSKWKYYLGWRRVLWGRHQWPREFRYRRLPKMKRDSPQLILHEPILCWPCSECVDSSRSAGCRSRWASPAASGRHLARQALPRIVERRVEIKRLRSEGGDPVEELTTQLKIYLFLYKDGRAVLSIVGVDEPYYGVVPEQRTVTECIWTAHRRLLTGKVYQQPADPAGWRLTMPRTPREAFRLCCSCQWGLQSENVLRSLVNISSRWLTQ